MSFNDGFSLKSIPFPNNTAVSGNALIYDGANWVAGSPLSGAITEINAGQNLTGSRSNGTFIIALSQSVTGLDKIYTTELTASKAHILDNLFVNGTASIVQLNTLNQNSLVVGDKYITILSGGIDHLTLDKSGFLWGSGSVGPTTNELGANAHIRFMALEDLLEIFPGIYVNGPTSGSTANFTSVTGSFNGNGNNITNLTASNITNFTADTRAQLTGTQYVDYNKINGQISLPFTGSILGTTPLILGQTITTLTGLTSISASVATFNELTSSKSKIGSMQITDLTVTNLYVSNLFEGTASVQPLVAATQIIPTTSLVKVSSSTGLDIVLTASPTIRTSGYTEGMKIYVVNVGTGKITFTRDIAPGTTGLKLVGGKSFAAAELECIQFVLVSGSSGRYWVESNRGA